MPKKSTRSKRGGQLDEQYPRSSYSSSPGQSYFDSAGNAVGDGWRKAKEYISGLTGSSQQTPYGSQGSWLGGKRHRRKMMMGGNFSPNTPLTGLAANAEPISGVPTASAQMVGGRTRRRRNKHRKSCKKSCRKH